MALGNLNSYLVETDEGFDESTRAQRWFLTFAVPNDDWYTLGTMIGQPVFGATSALTANAPIFAAWMVGSYVEFTTSGVQYVVAGFTSTTVLQLTGNASGEAAGDTFTVVHGYRVLPDQFAAPPAAPNSFPDKLAIDGTALKRRLNFQERPGWVIMRVTYGFDAGVVADNSSYITMRTILSEQSLDWSLDPVPKQMTGRIYIANKPTQRVYGVKGVTERNLIPYQVIRIYALLDETGRTAYAKPLVHKAVNVNDASWTFGGMTFTANTLMFRGVALDYSRRWGQSATHRIYNTVFEFIERPIAWPLAVNRYEWEEVTKQVDLYNDDGTAVVGKTKVGALSAVSATETSCIIRVAYAFDDILGSSTISGKLIS